MFQLPPHQQALIENILRFRRLADSGKRHAEKDIERGYRPMIRRDRARGKTFENPFASGVERGERAENFQASAQGERRSANDFERFDAVQLRVGHHPPLPEPLFGNRIAELNHCVVRKDAGRCVSGSGSPRRRPTRSARRRRHIADASEPVPVLQRQVNRRFIRRKRRRNIPADPIGFPQHGVIADRIDPADRSDPNRRVELLLIMPVRRRNIPAHQQPGAVEIAFRGNQLPLRRKTSGHQRENRRYQNPAENAITSAHFYSPMGGVRTTPILT